MGLGTITASLQHAKILCYASNWLKISNLKKKKKSLVAETTSTLMI